MGKLLKAIKPHLKAITGFIVSGGCAYLIASPHGVTANEWVEIIGAALAGGGYVWAIPNLPNKSKDSHD